MSTTPGQQTQAPSVTINLGVLLVLCFVILIVVSMGLVLTIGYDALTGTTREQLRQKSEIINLAISERIKARLDPIPSAARQFERLLALHKNADEPQTGALLSAMLETLPQASTIALVTPDLRVYRRFHQARADTPLVSDWSDDAGFRSMIATVYAKGRPQWGPLFFSEASGTTYLNFLHPVPDTGQTIIINVSIGALSHFLKEIEHELTGRPFILLDRTYVLAHADLDDDYPGLSDAQPLPQLRQFVDPVLRDIWSGKRYRDQEKVLTNGLQARVLDTGGHTYAFLFRDQPGYGAHTWQVGSYFPLDAFAPQFRRNRDVVIAGLGLIALAALAGVLLSRQISQPFKQFARTARRIANWQPVPEGDLEPSRIREIADTTNAFRAMISALRAFERYVPKPLVERLISGEQVRDGPAEELPVTIMFTDIIGFTGLAEPMQAAEVATMLNRHFELVDGCIEAQDGTVDKYIGDAVMAFWGGIHADTAQARHACLAALQIEAAIEAENRIRIASGEPPIRVRIGVHTGPAVIGNIGAPARINYTVIGDSVNTAARLEELARTVDDPAKDAITAISGDTAAMLGPEFQLTKVGEFVLEGRHEETEVFILNGVAATDKLQATSG